MEDQQDAVYGSYKGHFNAHRINTDLVMLEQLRLFYPKYLVTCTIPATCDLFGYAKAGHAKSTFTPEKAYDIKRTYEAPNARISGEPGVIRDSVNFGRFEYVWNNQEFIVYHIKYVETSCFKPPIENYYILSPQSGARSGASAVDELLMAVGVWTSELHDEIYVFDDGRWRKDQDLWTSVQGASWDDVILNPTVKANLAGDVQGFFDNQKLYKSLAVPWKRGLILHGVPGNGKTISIKALINALGARPDPVPSLYVKSFDSCQGKKSSIRNIFNHARKMAPCLLIFEDIDSLVTEKTRSYFLNEVDGLESNDGILMVGSTNHLDTLDPAISKRPSRFDRKYHFKLPNEKEREDYCRFWKKKLDNSPLVDFQEDICPIIAKLSEGFSFAYLKELFVIALLTIARGAQDEPDEEEEEAPKQEEEKTSSDTETVMVEHESKEGEKTKITIPETSKVERKRKVIPEVETPEHLKENVLLRVVRMQLKMLLNEMDNTTEEEWPSSRAQASAGAKESSSSSKITANVEAAKERFLARRAGKAA